MSNDPYFSRPEVSNSDLSALKTYWQPKGQVIDIEKAYRFGTLVDGLITEPAKVNVFNRTCENYLYTEAEMQIAGAMNNSFHRDPFCEGLFNQSNKQKVSIVPRFEITYGGRFKFHLAARGKWDLFVEAFDMSGEIKSTACTTQKQFEESIFYFEYDRQAAWYMDLEGRSNHMIIGISKTYPYSIFKVPIKRGEDLFNRGQANYQEIAFKYWSLFEHWPEQTTFNSTKIIHHE